MPSMAQILAKAQNGPTVKAYAAGLAAQEAMAAATDPDSYAAAAAALSDAFSILHAEFVTSYSHLAYAINKHKAGLTGNAT
jgi:hypothetical protein